MGTLRNRCAAVSAMLLLASCAPATRTRTSGRPPSSVALTVTNDNWLDVTVYAIRGAMRIRLGQVTGNGSAQLNIPRNVIVANSVQLMVDPIGSSERYVTDPISVDVDQRVQLMVAPAVNMSSYAVRVR